ILLPVPRFNAIFVAAPKARMNDVMRQIEQMDRKNALVAELIPIKSVPASRVAAQLNAFYATRYPPEAAAAPGVAVPGVAAPGAQGSPFNQIRITADDHTNSVMVQAAPADMAEIRELIAKIDNNIPRATNVVRVVYLNNAVADDLANLIRQAL